MKKKSVNKNPQPQCEINIGSQVLFAALLSPVSNEARARTRRRGGTRMN